MITATNIGGVLVPFSSGILSGKRIGMTMLKKKKKKCQLRGGNEATKRRKSNKKISFLQAALKNRHCHIIIIFKKDKFH